MAKTKATKEKEKIEDWVNSFIVPLINTEGFSKDNKEKVKLINEKYDEALSFAVETNNLDF